MQLKIIEYNIQNGFCNEMGYPYLLQNERLNAVANILEKENPDILILTEAYFWQFAKTSKLKNFKKLFAKLYNFYAPAHYNFRWAPIILSKLPVISYESSQSKFFLNFLRAKIKIKNKILTIDVFHPHPKTTEEQKLDFIKENVLEINNYIFTGDLNTLSPEDDYDKNKLIKSFKIFMGNKAEEKVKDMLKCKAVKFILDKDLLDTYKFKNKIFDFTVPTDLRSKNKNSGIRIDYIFCSKDFKILDSGIVNLPTPRVCLLANPSADGVGHQKKLTNFN
ncbi:endonuclease/exonuclease/phosphatase family protein [Candidatus Woesearchaeota archaeon]|nr:endonuclease/exonuclease/phosphatase family protein [Candidatus Woesearchaeota archaeon]